MNLEPFFRRYSKFFYITLLDKGDTMKRITKILILIFILFLSACSKDEDGIPTPTDFLNTFINHWEKEQFQNMYDMVTEESKDKYPTDQFIDRYEKIYKDLNIENISITFNELTEEQMEKALEEGTVTLPINVEMDSIADEITFRYDITLKQGQVDEDEDEENHEVLWEIEWDPGFIFPPLREGGEIALRTTEPKRGEILDRNKMPLAINDVVYEIGIVPGELGDHAEQEKQQIAEALNISVEAIDRELSASWVQPDLFVPIKKVPKTREDILAKLRNIPSIRSQEVTGRVYPLGEAAAHLTGYVGAITAEELEKQEAGTYSANDLIGKRGLEQLFEKRLKGERGIRIVVVNEGKEFVLAEKPAKDGEVISLTIDVNIQKEVFDSYEKEAGTAAVIHPQTGETLALVSSPAFDPNELLYGISQRDWDRLLEDPQTPLVNRFTATFAPGSVIKPITAAIGLQKGHFDLDEKIEIKGLTWAKDNWKDFEIRRVSESKGPVDLENALIRSDNIYFAMKAIDMGAEDFIKGLKEFGFEEDFPFAYPFVPSTISSTGNFANEVQVANTSYGQAEIEMSALHLATAYTPILNEGNMLKPVLELSEKTGEVWKEDLISAEHATFLNESLRKVVSEGTAQVINDEKFPISGKTGTVELKLSQDDQDGKLNGWFIGYPTKEEDLLISMMVEDVEGSREVVEKVAELLKTIKNK